MEVASKLMVLNYVIKGNKISNNIFNKEKNINTVKN